jgi:hypothetical protein
MLIIYDHDHNINQYCKLAMCMAMVMHMCIVIDVDVDIMINDESKATRAHVNLHKFTQLQGGGILILYSAGRHWYW